MEKCEVHFHLMPDGRCTCSYTCSVCGNDYSGYDHSPKDCRDGLVHKLISTFRAHMHDGDFSRAVAQLKSEGVDVSLWGLQ